MPDQDKEASLKLWLAVCWIAGVILAVIVTLIFSFEGGRLAPVSDEVIKWMGQILVPMCLLVLSYVFGVKIVKLFKASLKWTNVYWLTLTVSAVYIAFAIGTISVTAFARDAGKDTPDAKLRQLQILSNTGTTILTALIWPILSLLLDYLFPKSQSPSATSGQPAAALPDQAYLAAPSTPSSTP